ncbi:MAG: YhjD/YihY/BrkB family envelope integrity protein [Mycobacterium leprae]
MPPRRSQRSFPLLILVSAVTPTGSSNVVADAVVGKFRLTGDAAQVVQTIFMRPPDSSTGFLSVVLLVFSGVSLTRRMQRMYLQAWQLERRPGLRGSLNATLGPAVLVVEIGLLNVARTLIHGLPLHHALGWTVSVLAGLVLWTSVPWLLLDRRIRWRRLLPAGALAAVSASAYGLATRIYMPRLMESYSQRYGLFGVTLSLIGWLLCVAMIVVATTVVAAEFDRAQEPWARRLRARCHLQARAGDLVR